MEREKFIAAKVAESNDRLNNILYALMWGMSTDKDRRQEPSKEESRRCLPTFGVAA
ncbi:MAG: hypothetical protein HY548_00770 [Elusimicrobia bacterium]|nr:hypothetical protein [Elusimicrobiota bacterium]